MEQRLIYPSVSLQDATNYNCYYLINAHSAKVSAFVRAHLCLQVLCVYVCVHFYLVCACVICMCVVYVVCMYICVWALPSLLHYRCARCVCACQCEWLFDLAVIIIHNSVPPCRLESCVS